MQVMIENKVPMLRFCYFDGDWEKVRLKDVSRYFNGGSFEGDVKDEGELELITLKSINTDGNLVNSKRYIDKDVPTLVKGTLIMILSEQAPGLLGMTSIIPIDNKYVLNQRVAEIRPNQKVESHFLSMAININQRYFSKKGAGTKVQNITKPNVENYEFWMPTLPEQQKIASFLSAVDEKLQELNKKKYLLEEYKKGVMQQIFAQELRFKDANGNNYPDWEEKKLDEITWFQEGPGVRRSQYTKSGVKLLNVGNLEGNKLNLPKTDNYISDEQAFGVYKHFLVNDGDVLIACSGVSFHSYSSKICIANNSHLPLCMNTSTMRFKPLELLDANFLFQFLRSFKFKKQVFRVLSGSAQFNFGPTHIKYFKLNLPCLKEQQKIASFLTALDAKIELVTTQLNNTQAFKKGLLQQMFV
jgi:type I restriction enzyme S subunit